MGLNCIKLQTRLLKLALLNYLFDFDEFYIEFALFDLRYPMVAKKIVFIHDSARILALGWKLKWRVCAVNKIPRSERHNFWSAHPILMTFLSKLLYSISALDWEWKEMYSKVNFYHFIVYKAKIRKKVTKMPFFTKKFKKFRKNSM